MPGLTGLTAITFVWDVRGALHDAVWLPAYLCVVGCECGAWQVCIELRAGPSRMTGIMKSAVREHVSNSLPAVVVAMLLEFKVILFRGRVARSCMRGASVTNSVPVWSALAIVVGAVIAAVVNIYALRKNNAILAKTAMAAQDSSAAAARSADASMKSADAHTRSAGAASTAAQTAEKAELRLEKFSLHDDTMRTLYWAADHAISPDSNRALLGLEVLGRLADQAQDDTDHRARRIVSATNEAVRTVAVPTFLAVLTSAANNGDGTSGRIRTSAVEINAARLLLSYASDLSPEVRAEIELVAHAVPGIEVTVQELYTGRHLDQTRAPERDLGRELEHGDELGLGL